MNLTEAILLLLHCEPDRVIRGRTLLQKRMYFYGVLSKQGFGFRPHYYGPYSSTVSAELDALVSAGLIEDKTLQTGGVGPFGEVVRHDYTLESLEVLKDWSSGGDAQTAADHFRRIADHPVAKKLASLSAAAKVHFVLSSAGPLTVTGIADKASQLGWSLDPSQIDEVTEYLETLDLVEVRSGKKTS